MALATALAASTLAGPVLAQEPKPNTIIAKIPTTANPGPLVVDPIRGKVYVGSEIYQGSNTVQVIDEKTDTVIKTISVPTEANDMAIDPLHGKVYVSSEYSGDVLVIDEETDTVTASITAAPGPVFSPTGSFNYLVNNVKVDPLHEKVFVGVDQGGTSSNSYKGVTSYIAVVDQRTNKVTTQIAVPDDVRGLIVDPLREIIYDANSSLGPYSILAIDERSGKIKATIPITDQTQYFAIDEERGLLYASEDGFTDNPPGHVVLYPGTVSVIDERTNKIVDTITTAPIDPTGIGKAVTEGIVFDYLNKTLYVANGFTANILAIATRTDKITATIPTGGSNVSVDVDPARAKVYVSNYLNNAVYAIAAGGPTPWDDAKGDH